MLRQPPAERRRLKIGAGQAAFLVLQYGRNRLLEQVRSVAFITVFLVLVQSLVLGVPLRDAAGIALGIAGVVLGLALFMEGLLIGIMPLGETCGRVARLHQPGRGFIYMSPLRFGVINTRIQRGEVRHVASIEQVIAAIDTLKGDPGWRKKTTLPRARRERGYLRDLVSYTILGEESRVEELVRSALEAGAGGATVSSLRAAGRPAEGGARVSRARQASDLIIPADLVRVVHQAVLSSAQRGRDPDSVPAGEADKLIELSEVEKASTYRHR